MSPDFYLQSLKVPRSVSKKLPHVHTQLTTNPHAGPNIRRLRRWKGCCRYRIGDYRVLYRIRSKQDPRAVILFRVGPRKDIYRKPPGPEPDPIIIVPDSPDNDHAVIDEDEVAPDTPDLDVDDDEQLPPHYGQVLGKMTLTSEDRLTLQGCLTVGELFAADVQEDLVGRLVEALWPAPVDDTSLRVVEQPDDLRKAAEGVKSLKSFLLVLDERQKRLVRRFEDRPRMTGPWIVKGGPGTGKSTVALYCLRNLVHSTQPDLPGVSDTPRILFTTYTKALTNASADLLKVLKVDTSLVDVKNVDALAKNLAKPKLTPLYKRKHRDPVWLDVVKECGQSVAGYWFQGDARFLYDEVNQVIVGNGLMSCEEYEDLARRPHHRHRRDRNIGKEPRRALWQFAVNAQRTLEERERCLPAHLFANAMRHAAPTYDYVFVDEAQDLCPAALRMCVRLCKNGRNVFLAADRNQSIYRSGFTWKGVEKSLDMTGRSTILRRCHRSTEQIMKAVRQLLAGYSRVDNDTWDMEFVRQGPLPGLSWGSRSEEVDVVATWLKLTMDDERKRPMTEERFGLEHCAVLCPTNDDCIVMAKGLRERGLMAKTMKRNAVDLGYKGVSVMTMFAAKGIEFSIVAVVGLEEGRMPWTIEDQDEVNRLRRTFFVACSRAMRRLVVVAHPVWRSSFLERIDDDLWMIEPRPRDHHDQGNEDINLPF